MAAFNRGAPCLGIQPTQNTAPVHEFRCLFTHDLRKKKKVWHDGSLKFHTFNRRAMVYDESKNFLGDIHYRESDELQEGEELRLDRGVLVEVGERVGRTETDLAPLLERRRLEHGSSPKAFLLPPAARKPMLYAQGRSKSLADVLGASQGRIGRAMMPVRSPYDHRQQLLPGDEGSRAKRRRVAPGKENSAVAVGDLSYVTREINQVPSVSRPQAPLPQINQAMVPRDFIEISSEETVSDPPFFPSLSHPQRASQAKPSAAKGRAEARPALVRSRTALESAHFSNYVSPLRPGSLHPSTGPVTRLRLLPLLLPRSKLIYRDLLPSSTRRGAKAKATAPSLVSDDSATRGVPCPNSEVRRASRGSEVSEIFDVNDFDFGSIQNTPLISQSRQQSPQRSNCHNLLSSPLFVAQSQEYIQLDDLLKSSAYPNTPSPCSTPVPSRGSVPSREMFGDERQNRQDTITELSIQADSVSEKSLRQRHEMASPRLPLPTCSPRLQSLHEARPFRRVLSENDSPVRNADSISKLPTLHIPTAPQSSSTRRQTLPKNAAVTTMTDLTKPASLQRSASDSAALLPIVNEQPLAEDSPGSGPWSEREAFLLFDWWPPGRKKPSYASVSVSCAGATESGQQARRARPRAVLVDEC